MKRQEREENFSKRKFNIETAQMKKTEKIAKYDEDIIFKNSYIRN